MDVGRDGAPDSRERAPVAVSTRPGRIRRLVSAGVWVAGLVTALAISGYLYLVPGPADDHLATQTNGLQWATRRNAGTVLTDATLWFEIEKGSVALREVKYQVDGVSAEQIGEPLLARKKPGADFVDTIAGYPPTPQQFAEQGLVDVRPLKGATITARPDRAENFSSSSSDSESTPTVVPCAANPISFTPLPGSGGSGSSTA